MDIANSYMFLKVTFNYVDFKYNITSIRCQLHLGSINSYYFIFIFIFFKSCKSNYKRFGNRNSKTSINNKDETKKNQEQH